MTIEISNSKNVASSPASDLLSNARIEADPSVRVSSALAEQLSDQYSLSSSSKQQLDELVQGLSKTDLLDLKEALAHSAISADKRGALIDVLHSIKTSARFDGISANEILSDTIHQIADPLDANQSNKCTCTVVTGVQTRMLLTDPIEYARLIDGLSSAAGTVELKSGNQIIILEDSIPADRTISGGVITSRSLASRIFQSACMQYAAGYEKTASGQLVFDYDPVTDVTKDNLGGVGYIGLFADKHQKMANDIFNEGSTVIDTTNIASKTAFRKNSEPEEVLSLVKKQLLEGIPVTAEVRTNSNDQHSDHQVLILKIEDGRVHFKNGWQVFQKFAPSHKQENTADGRIESMSVEDYAAILRSVNIADRTKSAANADLTAISADRVYRRELRTDGPQVARVRPPTASITKPDARTENVKALEAEPELTKIKASFSLSDSTFPDQREIHAGAFNSQQKKSTSSNVRLNDEDLV